MGHPLGRLLGMASAVFGSAAVQGGDLTEALDRASDQAAEALGGAQADLGFLFVTPGWEASVAGAARRLRTRHRVRHLVGCTAGGVCETAGEFETGPAVSVLLGSIPHAHVRTFAVRQDQLLTFGGPRDLRRTVGFSRSAEPSFILLADPFTVDPQLLLDRLEEAYPSALAAGGMAGGGARPGANVLFRDGSSLKFGAVGVAITGHPIRAAVSQGCRPVGRRFIVTRCDDRKVITLSGRPALEAIHAALADLDEADQVLARENNLLIGRVSDEARDDFGHGDFLIRNFVGFVPEEGAVVVADTVRVGQTVQLQLRDRQAAEADLDQVLKDASVGPAAAGALLFSCAGRGSRLFGEEGHDVRAVARHFGDLPLSGLFSSGEIGSIRGRNFLHGFTASLALL